MDRLSPPLLFHLARHVSTAELLQLETISTQFKGLFTDATFPCLNDGHQRIRIICNVSLVPACGICDKMFTASAADNAVEVGESRHGTLVHRVWPDSMAARAGVRVGDHVLESISVPIDEQSSRFLLGGIVSEMVVFRCGDGECIHVPEPCSNSQLTNLCLHNHFPRQLCRRLVASAKQFDDFYGIGSGFTWNCIPLSDGSSMPPWVLGMALDICHANGEYTGLCDAALAEIKVQHQGSSTLESNVVCFPKMSTAGLQKFNVQGLAVQCHFEAIRDVSDLRSHLDAMSSGYERDSLGVKLPLWYHDAIANVSQFDGYLKLHASFKQGYLHNLRLYPLTVPDYAAHELFAYTPRFGGGKWVSSVLPFKDGSAIAAATAEGSSSWWLIRFSEEVVRVGEILGERSEIPYEWRQQQGDAYHDAALLR
ncbi:unnamed protein product [Polarella glacialis]|uniref:Uncharacterized protein n=1 Tax=Polarella glacialis TaxID=89957 RepID=A0A813ILK0_POLGL|nr:unnamed protein product [Polarella glacialis]CAE8653284.1 unnamed protein product [Polarella glacialis]